MKVVTKKHWLVIPSKGNKGTHLLRSMEEYVKKCYK